MRSTMGKRTVFSAIIGLVMVPQESATFSPALSFTNTRTTTFSNSMTQPLRRRSPDTFILGAKRKKKQTMAEKRKARQVKARDPTSKNLFANLPRANLDFSGGAGTAAAILDKPQKLSDPVEAAEKAQELLRAQRASVDTLTLVRERIESQLQIQDLADASIDPKQGHYCVIDNFLNDESLLLELEDEAKALYHGDQMEMDMSNLGAGEYTVSIKGGTEQYSSCPRIVELVVSSTKHIPETLASVSKEGENGAFPPLDASSCMATLRTFDRKAFQASLALLTGSDDNEEIPENKKPFGLVVPADKVQEDKRRLSLSYFVVPESWDENSGGGLEFTSKDSIRDTMIAAKRDRLVIWKSDSCSFRRQPWRGNDSFCIGSCIELHLLEKRDTSE